MWGPTGGGGGGGGWGERVPGPALPPFPNSFFSLTFAMEKENLEKGFFLYILCAPEGECSSIERNTEVYEKAYVYKTSYVYKTLYVYKQNSLQIGSPATNSGPDRIYVFSKQTDFSFLN